MLSVTESSSDFDQEREERMKASDGASETALERSLSEWIPLDVAAAAVVLREAKQILDDLGVVFFLRQGTCLGAIRDHGFIPWDDDLDLGSVIGLHGFSEKSVDRVVAAFRKNGFFARVEHQDQCIYVSMIKSAVRTDWMCYPIIDDSIFHYPGTRIPVRLLTNLKEIEFIGEKFYVPNPPDEYLRLKYGEEWMIPKKTGFEKDVLDLIPEAPLPGRAGRLKQFLIKHVMPWRTSRLRILNHKGEPVAGADVVVAGLGRAFFYAGTRSILVSLWPVETTSAQKLINGLFRYQKKDNKFARARAFRNSMLDLIDDPGLKESVSGKIISSYAHPLFWAPFIIVGESGSNAN